MTCPPIDELLAGGAAEHAGGCDDCGAVLELVAARSVAGCARAEALMAARASGRIAPGSARLLALHLASCASCALVAGSLDAPEIADTLAGAAELDRSLDGPLTVGGDDPPGDLAHGQRASTPSILGRGRRSAALAPRRGPRHVAVAVAVLALLAIAAIAAVLTRALG